MKQLHTPTKFFGFLFLSLASIGLFAQSPETQDIWVNHYRPFSPDPDFGGLCLLTKSASSLASASWEIHAGDIDGFHYEWGKRTLLRVAPSFDAAGQPQLKLVEVLEQQQMPPGTFFSITVAANEGRDWNNVIRHLQGNRFRIVGGPTFEARNTLLTETMLAYLAPNDALRLEMMHASANGGPLVLDQIYVNELPLPQPSHLYLVLGIVVITALGLYRRPRTQRIRRRRFRPAAV